ncbi:MAG: hypothetical protein EA404_02820 [Spirochaetaceae bacterium]|nr:MAG: hypothetical protein EA404_02820 [Spirochaetaceae bacterium]
MMTEKTPDAGLPSLPVIHFVSGFLGSGKTTAIVGLCRLLMGQGVRTAIVTNDQGRRQVDLAFARAGGIPAVAVSNGCLCCRWDDFEERVLALAADEQPQLIFAESVGSCADLVATVIKPFTEFRDRLRPRGRLSTFVDIRMLEARLTGVTLPFSQNVLYIFDKQLEEADIILVNKRDRFSDESARADRVHELARQRFPHAAVILSSALDNDDLLRWNQLLSQYDGVQEPAALEIDYERYAAGEMELAWLDQVVRVRAAPECRAAAIGLIQRLAAGLQGASAAVGHFKCTLTPVRPAADGAAESTGATIKLSLTTMDAADDLIRQLDALPRRMGPEAELTINIRALAEPLQLKAVADSAVAATTTAFAAMINVTDQHAFRPGYPTPVHRFSRKNKD